MIANDHIAIKSAQSRANACNCTTQAKSAASSAFADNRPDHLIQRQIIGRIASSQPVQREENRTGMPDQVKSKMEKSFNTDFSNVQVTPNSAAAPKVGALAFTQGNNVHFAPGQFKPNTIKGQQLIGHELAHVVQQRKGMVKPTTQVGGMPVNDSPRFEKEADILGRKAARTQL